MVLAVAVSKVESLGIFLPPAGQKSPGAALKRKLTHFGWEYEKWQV